MREVSDGFLLNLAEVSSGLIGLFLVGMFFFAETGFRRLARGHAVVVPYFRASTRIVLILFAFPLLESLALVALDPMWARLLFLVLSVMLVAANVDTARRIRGVARATGSTALLANEVLGSAAVALLVVLPWVLGGLRPTREDLTLSILLSFVAGFASISTVVLSVFDFPERSKSRS